MRKLLLLLAVPCLSCSLLKQVAASAIDKPTLSFQDLKFDRVDFEGADLRAVYQVTNPNSVGLDLAQSDYAFEVEGHPVATGKPNGLKVPAHETSTVEFPTHVVWKELAPAVEALFAQDSVQYKASGNLGLNTPMGVVALPLSHEGTFSTPKMPSFDLQPPRVSNLSLTGATLTLPLKIANKNGFPLPLGGILGSVQIAGEKVGRMALPAQGLVAASQEKTVQIPLQVSFLSVGSAVASALRSGSAAVVIDGALQAGGASLPVHVAQTVQLQR